MCRISTRHNGAFKRNCSSRYNRNKRHRRSIRHDRDTSYHRITSFDAGWPNDFGFLDLDHHSHSNSGFASSGFLCVYNHHPMQTKGSEQLWVPSFTLTSSNSAFSFPSLLSKESSPAVSGNNYVTCFKFNRSEEFHWNVIVLCASWILWET